MAGRSIAGQKTQLQREVTPGTPVTNNMLLVEGLRLIPAFEGAADPFKGITGKVATSVILPDIRGTWAATAVQCYNAIGLVAASRISGTPTTTTPSGGTLSRKHVFSLNPDGEDSKATYTAQYGDSVQAVQGVFGVFQSLGIEVVRGALGLTTGFMSREPSTGITLATVNEVQTITMAGPPTAGTFTLTYDGQTTTGIAFNATAAAVQAALELLTNIGTGNVLGAGGPLPGTAVTITFQGTLAGKNVSLMTANSTGLTGGTASVAATTSGSPSTLSAVPISPRGYDVYADDTWAALGTTKLLACYRMNVALGDKFQPDSPINSAIVSYESAMEAEDQSYAFDATFGFDAAAVGLINTFKNGVRKYFRLLVNGPIIEGAITYRLQVDFAAFITSIGEIGTAPNSPAVTIPMTLELARDPITAKACDLTLINTVLAY